MGGKRVVHSGVDSSDDVADLLRVLPGAFLDSYLALHLLSSAKTPVAEVGVSGARAVVRTSTNQTETRGPARSARAGLSTRHVITSEWALVQRRKFDRRLRQLGRDIRAAIDGAYDVGVRSGVRRCTRCKMFTDGDWNFCPFDGQRTEEIV